MPRILTLSTLLVIIASLAGCASGNLHAPCPNFGASCTKLPVNISNDQYFF